MNNHDTSGIYWWVFGYHDGVPVQLGPFSSEYTAETQADTIHGESECVPLHTRNTTRAIQLMRMKRKNSGESLSQVMRRTKHKVPNSTLNTINNLSLGGITSETGLEVPETLYDL